MSASEPNTEHYTSEKEYNGHSIPVTINRTTGYISVDENKLPDSLLQTKNGSSLSSIIERHFNAARALTEQLVRDLEKNSGSAITPPGL